MLWLLHLLLALAAVPLQFSVQRGDTQHEISGQQKLVKGAYFESIGKRDGSALVRLRNEHTFYVSDLDINGQKVGVMVDTGSADLWVPSKLVKCLEVGSPDQTTNTCTDYGSYATGDLDLWKKNDTAPPFDIKYADDTEALGVWGRDTIDFDGTKVESLLFAVVNQTLLNIGVLGIGLPGLELTNSRLLPGHSPYQYENLPVKLRNQGVIKRTVYSVFMDHAEAEHGTILFGAVDHAKYDGSLTRLPILNTRRDKFDEPAMLEVVVAGVEVSQGDDEVQISDNKYAALLDMGLTSLYFPTSLFKKFTGTLGAIDTNIGARVDCKYSELDVKVELDFSGTKIDFPLKDLLIPYDGKCFLGIFEQDTDFITIGDNMLRHAYWVYDYDNFEVSVAQTKFTSDTDVEEVDSPEVPGASTAEHYSSTSLLSNSEGSASSTITPTQAKAVKTDDSELSESGSEEDTTMTRTKTVLVTSDDDASATSDEQSETSESVSETGALESSSEASSEASEESSEASSKTTKSAASKSAAKTTKSEEKSQPKETDAATTMVSAEQSALAAGDHTPSTQQKAMAASVGVPSLLMLLLLI